MCTTNLFNLTNEMELTGEARRFPQGASALKVWWPAAHLGPQNRILFMLNIKPSAKIGRYILLVWLIPVFYQPGIDYIYRLIGLRSEWYWYDIISHYYNHVTFVLLLVILVYFHKIDWRRMFGPWRKADLPRALKLTAFLYIFSIAAVYAIFYPLSYIHPEFVKYWYIDISPLIYSLYGKYPFLPNAMSFTSIVVLAPVVEEFAFRGLLLPRWNKRWGIKKSILISSILFGIIHPDPIGATAFGIAMCLLYLQTGTLFVPMFCHATNNLVAWFVEVGYFTKYGPDYRYSLKGFRDEWFIGVFCGLIVFVWVSEHMKNPKNLGIWQLPKV